MFCRKRFPSLGGLFVSQRCWFLYDFYQTKHKIRFHTCEILTPFNPAARINFSQILFRPETHTKAISMRQTYTSGHRSEWDGQFTVWCFFPTQTCIHRTKSLQSTRRRPKLWQLRQCADDVWSRMWRTRPNKWLVHVQNLVLVRCTNTEYQCVDELCMVEDGE